MFSMCQVTTTLVLDIQKVLLSRFTRLMTETLYTLSS
jgi:hypothetical protein